MGAKIQNIMMQILCFDATHARMLISGMPHWFICGEKNRTQMTRIVYDLRGLLFPAETAKISQKTAERMFNHRVHRVLHRVLKVLLNRVE
jgi:hypothetical protein